MEDGHYINDPEIFVVLATLSPLGKPDFGQHVVRREACQSDLTVVLGALIFRESPSKNCTFSS